MLLSFVLVSREEKVQKKAPNAVQSNARALILCNSRLINSNLPLAQSTRRNWIYSILRVEHAMQFMQKECARAKDGNTRFGGLAKMYWKTRITSMRLFDSRTCFPPKKLIILIGPPTDKQQQHFLDCLFVNDLTSELCQRLGSRCVRDNGTRRETKINQIMLIGNEFEASFSLTYLLQSNFQRFPSLNERIPSQRKKVFGAMNAIVT